jgi:hypothetical protein
MDKKIVGLLGAAAALTTMTAAAVQAAPAQATDAAAVTSYRDLLDPVPNAVPLLNSDNARLAKERESETTRVAQISVQVGHHHHHHVRVYHHHHHHHRHHHHHHHHHHH